MIVYDASLRRPGCVLLQALMGGNVPDFANLFPAECWLLAPTPGLRAYPVTPEQLARLVEMADGPRADSEGRGEG